MMKLGSIDGKPKQKKLRAVRSIGPLRKGVSYPLIELVGDRYTMDINGVHLSYPVSYFYYK